MSYHSYQTDQITLAKREFARVKSQLQSLGKEKTLQPVPENFLEFVETAKPKSEGKMRNFPLLPFWKDVYQDNHSFRMIIGGRQIGKTTFITDLLAHKAITSPGSQMAYITNDLKSLGTFSRQKLYPSLRQNPAIASYLKNKSGVGEVAFKNDSRIYCLIANNGYRNIEGKTLDHVILDEVQYHPLHEAQKVFQTMSTTNGTLTMCGIGSDAGSALEDYWNSSSQFEWQFNDSEWRKHLQFDGYGLVWGRYLEDVMSGNWVAQNPDSEICHGYHLSKMMFPTVPLTMEDAKKLYRKNPVYSIEYDQKYNPPSLFITHVLGRFHKSPARPITHQMVLGSMIPYSTMGGLLSISEVREFKEIFGDKIRISVGVDFGSGNSSSTVIAVIIEWKLKEGLSRYTLARIEKRPAEHQMDQAAYILKMFMYSLADIGVADLGYGTNQVKFIQDGGYSRSGEYLEGAGDKNFFGCRTTSDDDQPLVTHPEKRDEHGDTVASISLDKTFAIQQLIDLFDSYVPHPIHPDTGARATKLIIPYEKKEEVDWLIHDLTKITRRDLLPGNMSGSRRAARKEFNHPPDSAMAIIYAMTGLGKKMPDEWIVLPTPNTYRQKRDYFYPEE